MIGKTISRYRITEKLGEGGMGVVYLAEDPTLGRRVALKVLSEKFVGQQEPLQRFLAEARLASSINHPNIVAIYELGEEQGQRFISMEYVPGKSLRAVLKSQRLPLRKLLDLALPAAEALARAHRAGVIHRDIKPENLLVSDDGYIKIADFGLAKLKPAAGGDAAVTEEVLTDAGRVMGTAAYMSPEQLQAREADARSDVFAFGAVLYEMAAGKSPFLRDSAAHTTAAILRDTPPPVSSLAGDIPAEFGHIVEKALEKEPEYRYQSMDELASDLKRLRRDLEAGRASGAVELPRAVPTPRSWKLPALVGVLVLALAAVGWLAWRGWQAPAPSVPGRVVQFTALPGLEDSPTWSPDGRSLAYVSDEAGQLDIYVQQIAGGRAIRLTDSNADDTQPAWSPDGSQIAFVSSRAYQEKRLSTMLNMGTLQPFFAGRNGDVWVMPALGGTARRIAEDAYYPSWSPDGKQLVYQAMRDGNWGIWVSGIEGGSKPRLLTSPDSSVVTQPAWSPDGKWIAYCQGRPGRVHVSVISSEGGTPKATTPENHNALTPSWSPDSRWLYFSSDRGGTMNLWKARFAPSGLSDYEQVTSGVEANIQARPDPSGTRLAYSSVRVSLDLWEYDLSSKNAARLTSETTQEDVGLYSPDGKWLSFLSNRHGTLQVWLQNRQDGGLTQVSTATQVMNSSRWSHDSKFIYYFDTAGSAMWRYEIATGNMSKVADLGSPGTFFAVSPDDRFLLTTQPEGIVKMELASGRKEMLVPQPPGETVVDPACSPDGQWVAYYQQQGNDRKIWVVPFAGGTPRQVTFGQGEHSHPFWSPDSRQIYFLRNHQDVYVVPREGGESRPITSYQSFSILLDYPSLSADGRKIVFTRNDKGGDIFLLESPAGR